VPDKNRLADALQVIGDVGDQWDIQGVGEPSLEDFFDRAAARLGSFGPIDGDRFLRILDPEDDVEPHELYGC
jgi:hypothetical protein